MQIGIQIRMQICNQIAATLPRLCLFEVSSATLSPTFAASIRIPGQLRILNRLDLAMSGSPL